MLETLQSRLQRLGRRFGLHREWYLIAIGAVIGTITALGAVGFLWLLHKAELGATQALDVWPWWTLPLIPMLGALFTGLIIHNFANEARGHGVPEVMDALYRRGGRIRLRVALAKALASACSIGSGGSAGAEGPIVQIGSAIGSGIAQLLRVSREQTGTLLGCGAAAGIASVFNAPIAGVFFVLEILLRDFSLRTFTPIVVASVFSTAITQTIAGENIAVFEISASHEGYVFTIAEFPSYILLGLICGLVAVAFTRSIYATEDLFEKKIKLHPILKPVLGALFLGALGIGYLMLESSSPDNYVLPPFFGNGYPAITELLDPTNYDPTANALAANQPIETHAAPHGGAAISTTMWVLLFLVGAKLVATCLTLGSGGSGGVFAPSLFLGAATGAFIGVGLEKLGLIPDGGSPASYALVGMAAVVAGSTHAPLTAILIVFEITRDPYVLLPIMLGAIVSTAVARILMHDSIYSLKLRRRGVLIGSAADLTILRRITARQVPTVPHVSIHPEDAISKLLELNRQYQVVDFVVVDAESRYLGMVTAQDLRTALIEREAMPLLLVEDLLRTDLPTIEPDESLDSVLGKFSRHDVSSLVMTAAAPTPAPASNAGGQVLGLITRSRLMQRYQQALNEG